MLSRVALFLLIFVSLSAFSNSSRDSLVNVLASLPDGNKKLSIYRAIYKAHDNLNTDTVLHFLHQENKCALRIGNNQSVGRSHLSIALFKKRKGDYDSAIYHHLEAAKIFKELDMHSYYAHSLNNIGIIALTAGDFSNALKFFDKASIIFKQSSEKKTLAKVYWNMGICYQNLSDYHQAHYAYIKALEISKGLNNAYLLYKAYNYLGQLEFVQQCYSGARERYNQSILHVEKQSDRNAILLSNIGQSYLAENEYARAEEYLNRALEMKLNLDKSENSRMVTLTFLGELEIQKGNLKKGIAYLERGIDLGDTLVINEELTDAIDLLTHANTQALQQEMSIDVFKSLAAAAVLGIQHKRLRDLKNRLRSSDIQNTLNYRIEINKKDAQIASISKVNERVIFLSIILTLLAVILILMNKNIRTKKSKVDSRLEEIGDNAEKAIRILKESTVKV